MYDCCGGLEDSGTWKTIVRIRVSMLHDEIGSGGGAGGRMMMGIMRVKTLHVSPERFSSTVWNANPCYLPSESNWIPDASIEMSRLSNVSGRVQILAMFWPKTRGMGEWRLSKEAIVALKHQEEPKDVQMLAAAKMLYTSSSCPLGASSSHFVPGNGCFESP